MYSTRQIGTRRDSLFALETAAGSAQGPLRVIDGLGVEALGSSAVPQLGGLPSDPVRFQEEQTSQEQISTANYMVFHLGLLLEESEERLQLAYEDCIREKKAMLQPKRIAWGLSQGTHIV